MGLVTRAGTRSGAGVKRTWRGAMRVRLAAMSLPAWPAGTIGAANPVLESGPELVSQAADVSLSGTDPASIAAFCSTGLVANTSLEQVTGATKSIGDPIPALWALESG